MKNNVLFINTCSDRLQLAVKTSDGESRFVGEPAAKKHNAELLGRIDSLLSERKITVKDLDYIAVAVGPGSFTGIRIGVAAALAMRRASKAETVGVSTLETVGNGSGVAALTCGHGEFYTLCGGEYGTMTEAELSTLKNVVYVSENTLDEFIKTAESKIANGEKGLPIKPFYIKKSSAEREKENNV